MDWDTSTYYMNGRIQLLSSENFKVNDAQIIFHITYSKYNKHACIITIKIITRIIWLHN